MCQHFPPLRKPRSGTVSLARGLLWTQAVVFAIMWSIPNGTVVWFVVTEGIPHDGSAGWLLVPVIFTAPLLVFLAPGAVLAARFGRGQGVRRGIIAWEAVVLGAAVVSVVVPGASMLFGMMAAPPLLLPGEVLPGVYVLVVLLGSSGGRDRFASS